MSGPPPGSNYRLPEHGLSFTIGDHDETEAGFVTHLAASTVDAQAITAPPISDSDEAPSALDEAADFLTAYLAGGIGPGRPKCRRRLRSNRSATAPWPAPASRPASNPAEQGSVKARRSGGP